MLSRRIWLRLSVTFALLLAFSAAVYLGGRYLLQRGGVEDLNWSGLSLSADGLHIDSLNMRQRSAAGTLSLQSHSIGLAWRDFGFSLPFWQHLEIDRLSLDWQPAAESATPSTAATDLDLQQLSAPLAVLPLSLQVAQLDATLPCARRRCTATGDLSLLRGDDDHLRLQLNLDYQAQIVSGLLELQPAGDAFDLTLSLAVDQQPQITLHSKLQQVGDGMTWSGKLDAMRLTQAATLQNWLSAWTVPDDAQWPDAPGEVSLSGTWQLNLPRRELDVDNLLASSGQFDLQGNLPQPWPFPNLGQLQGQLAMAAHNEGQQWIASRLEADLQLTEPSGDWLQSLPPELRGESLHIEVQPDAALDNLRADLADRSLPLKVTAALRGATHLDLQGRLAVASAAPWAVQFADTRLNTSTAKVNQAGWQAGELTTNLNLAGYADGNAVELNLGQGSAIQTATLKGAELAAQRLQVALGGTALNLTLQDDALQGWQFKGPLNLSTTRLEQANLKPQGWHLQGQVTAADLAGTLRGKVTNDSELQLDLDASLDTKQTLQLKATLGELFLRSGNPLAKTLVQWPELLDLNSGRVNATANLTLAAGSNAPSVDLNLTGKGLGGIYDRSELSGLDTRLQFKLARQRFDLAIQELKIQQANPGLPIGPIEARGRYSASLASVDKGQLEVNLARTALMGGQVTLTPGQWDLAAGNQLFPIQVRGLELQQLFALYPAEGLAGSGTLDGDLPVRLGQKGIEVENGQIAARQPGGHLQFSSEKIKALGRSNPAMQLVTQSLEDFRFTTLSSSVDYDQHGKLRLAMRLEGQNPAIENGRPIHFNINLEEDIPNLLASLQLTDRVNEIITRRVQQRILQRNTAPKEP
ncbi:intermembrane phospholipid transport protein YdbH family protein [Phytopseudomonas punonensis]|uniref:Dicarboxylate transport n=1 Tax=Phytopseudomonas punonensis TaxID=1220495 RepID=A0A1M7CN92_9GAMM|nr:YdbH domain-containing protein [Pseudomonas punonensis]SHL68652.1 Dicarboxylate transport [Pseudomonas punonensis]